MNFFEMIDMDFLIFFCALNLMYILKTIHTDYVTVWIVRLN